MIKAILFLIKAALALVYIVLFGGLVLPITLGGVLNKHPLRLPLKYVLWWALWIVAFVFFILWSLGQLLFRREDPWTLNLAGSFDQTANAVLDGDRDLTVSSALGKKIIDGKAYRSEILFCKCLSLFDNSSDHHCESSIGS